jgi:hypothetical protein
VDNKSFVWLAAIVGSLVFLLLIFLPDLGIMFAPAAIGGVFLWFGFREQARLRLIRDLPTSTIRAMAMGPVELKGKAIPLGDTVKSPFTGKSCVYLKFLVEEKVSSGKNSHWRTRASEEKRVPFVLDDGTGKILLDTQGAKLDVPADTTLSSGMLQDPPGAVKEFLAAHNIPYQNLFGLNRKMRFQEFFIEKDQQIYVLANAERKGEEVVLGKIPDLNLLYITDRKDNDILGSYRLRALGSLILGAVLVVFSTVMIALVLSGTIVTSA